MGRPTPRLCAVLVEICILSYLTIAGEWQHPLAVYKLYVYHCHYNSTNGSDLSLTLNSTLLSVKSSPYITSLQSLYTYVLFTELTNHIQNLDQCSERNRPGRPFLLENCSLRPIFLLAQDFCESPLFQLDLAPKENYDCHRVMPLTACPCRC